MYSQQTIGKVVEQTPTNEKYVAIKKVSEWLHDGYTPKEIALIWNGGEIRCKAGVNKYGVSYDTCAYANKFLTYLK